MIHIYMERRTIVIVFQRLQKANSYVRVFDWQQILAQPTTTANNLFDWTATLDAISVHCQLALLQFY